jgi:hypothetical protein
MMIFWVGTHTILFNVALLATYSWLASGLNLALSPFFVLAKDQTTAGAVFIGGPFMLALGGLVLAVYVGAVFVPAAINGYVFGRIARKADRTVSWHYMMYLSVASCAAALVLFVSHLYQSTPDIKLQVSQSTLATVIVLENWKSA